MAGLFRAVGRLILMAAVMGVVVVTSIYAGLAATVAVGLAILLAGIVGMAGAARRRAPMVAAPIEHPVVVAMAPQSAVAAAATDPEANMPRWRRPSLMAARHTDPSRYDPSNRVTMRFTPDTAPPTAELRVIRYAMVPLLDRPDEVLGLQLADLMAGDEIQVVESSGVYWEVVCPDGERGWVHRTTLGMATTLGREPVEGPKIDVDDALTALLAARGLN
jgi:hypothetical protein